MNLSAINKATKGNTRTGGISDFMELPIDKVIPNPEQPRTLFKDQEIEELAAAIARDGLLQPIVVTKQEDKYLIVSGERRYRAHLFIGKKTIQAHIIRADDSKVLELALIENIQREDLTDFETAMHISKLWLSKRYSSKSELAKAIGKSQSYLSKAFGCLNLHPEIQKDLEENKRDIGLSVLEEIARIKEKDMQLEPYKLYNDGEIRRDDIKGWRDKKLVEDVHPKKTDTKHENRKEVSFEEVSFPAIEDDFRNGIIFHPSQNKTFKINNLKSYKMYRITIEEI